MDFKKQLIKLGFVVIIVVGFLVVMNVFQQKEKMVSVDPEKFTIVNSEKELNKRLAQHIAGYELASEYDLVKVIGLEFPLMKENRTLRIDKTWYYRDKLFILYSYDLKNGDDDPKEFPSLNINDITIETGDSKTHHIVVDQYFRPVDEYNLVNGYVYNNRIYKGEYLSLTGIYDNEQLIRKLNDGLEIKKLSLNNPVLTRKKLGEDKEEFQLDNISFNLDFKFQENGTLKKIKLNQETEFANGDKIYWKEFNIGLDSNMLRFTVEPHNAKIRNLVYDMKFPEGYIVPEEFSYVNGSYPINITSSGEGDLFIPSFREIPDYITLEMKSVEYLGDETVQYKISGNEIANFFKETTEEKYKEVINKKEVGKTQSYTFTHESLRHFEINNNNGTGLKLGISLNERNNNIFNMFLMTNAEYQERINMLKQDPNNPYLNSWINLTGPIIKFTNENNEEINSYGTVDMGQLNTHAQTQTILLSEQGLKTAKELKVDIFNIPESIDIKGNSKVKIQIN